MPPVSTPATTHDPDYDALLAVLSAGSVRRNFNPYDDIDWDAPHMAMSADDPRWEHDVGRSFAWLGGAWVDALGELDVAGAVAHAGPLVRTRWSDLVCFAGLGPGEVTVGGAKVVGISQRRTRAAARFQCGVLHRWDPAALLALLRLTDGERVAAAAELGSVAAGIGARSSADVVEALAAALGRTAPPHTT